MLMEHTAAKLVLINLSFQKESSPVQFVTIIGRNILNAISTFGKVDHYIIILDHSRRQHWREVFQMETFWKYFTYH